MTCTWYGLREIHGLGLCARQDAALSKGGHDRGIALLAAVWCHNQNGLNRHYFLPFIDLLKTHCKIVDISSAVDHRRTAAVRGSPELLLLLLCDTHLGVETVLCVPLVCSPVCMRVCSHHTGTKDIMLLPLRLRRCRVCGQHSC